MLQIENITDLQNYLNDLPPKQPVIGFFVNRVYHNQHKWLDAIAAKCRERGYTTIGLMTESSKDLCEFRQVDVKAIISPYNMRELKRINMFILSEIDAAFQFPPESKVLGCQHALYCNQDNLTLASYSRWMHMLDGFIIPMQLSAAQRQNVPLLWNNFLSKKYGERKRDDFYIFPAPYPRLAMMQQELAKWQRKPDSIIYAPVWATHSPHRGGMRIRDYGAPMLGRLLEEFPSMNIIFRPSFQDVGNPEVLKILDAYSSSARFIFDCNIEQVPAFSRGAILITDISFVGKSFTFSTLRPAIEYQPWTQGEAGLDKNAGCYREYSLDALVAQIRDMLDSPEKYAKSLEAMRDQLVVPLENGLDHLADMIEHFLAGEPENGWLHIPRFFSQPPDDADVVRRLEKHAAGREDFPAALAAMSALPESPLLTAYAIHMGKLRNPSFPRFLKVGDPWSSILGNGVQLPIPYEEIPPDMVVKLYMLALKEKQHNQDSQGAALVLKLMKEFKQFAKSGFVPEPQPL